MSANESDDCTGVQAVLEEALDRGEREADPREVAEADSRLEELLEKVADPSASEQTVEHAPAASAAAGALVGVAMRTALPVALCGRTVALKVRGVAGEVSAELAAGLDAELVKQALRHGDAVVVECAQGEPPLVVGVLQQRIPAEITIRAKKLHLEGDEEVLLRSGRGALRIRSDGDVELVGSRIAAMSRGLFRLVGRVLRLN